jgi:hypothetical protein
MFELQPPDRKPPPCPVCTHEMVLKKIHRQQPADHLIFKCGHCAIEYPVVSEKRD